MKEDHHLFGWVPQESRWAHLTRGSEADMYTRLGALMDAAKAERKPEFAAFVSPDPEVPAEHPDEINIEVHDFSTLGASGPSTEDQMDGLEAVHDYLTTARRYVAQAFDEMSEMDYTPLMRTDVAARLGLIAHSVLMSLDEAASDVRNARSNGRKALARKED